MAVGSEPCCVLQEAAENCAVFKRNLKEASEGTDRRSDSREFHTEGCVMQNMKRLLVLRTEKQMVTGVVWPVDSLTVVQEGMAVQV